MGQKLLGYQLNRYKELVSLGHGTFSSHAVNQLLGHIKELDDDITIRNKAISEMQQQIDRLIENVSQLNREKHELEEKLEAADELVLFNSREEKKVVLPREVAEAIEWFRKQMCDNKSIYELSLEPSDGEYASRLYYWSDTGPGDGDSLMEALVNGYTVEVEPTTEDRIRDNISASLIEMNVSSPVPVERLAKALTLAVRNVLAEDRQAETQ